MLHSDIPALLPNQEIKFLSEIEHPLREVEQTDEVLNRTHVQREVLMTFLLWQKHIDLNHIGLNMVNNFPVILTLCTQLINVTLVTQRHREKRFISALLKGLCRVTQGASIFGRLISSVKKLGGYIFKGIHGLFHHHKVQAIYHAVNTFKKYHSKLKIGQLFKFKAYCDLHISKVSLYDKLNKALHQYGNQMNHQIFL